MPGAALYHLARCAFRVPKAATVRVTTLHAERARRRGGFIIACTHISHMDPIAVMMTCPRQVRWLTRIEFYRRRWPARLLHASGMIPVDRFGNSLPAIRAAIRAVRAGHVVGIFPEGGVARGGDTVLRGGAIKQGVGVVARVTGAPIVPVVVLGTERLQRARAWLPLRRTRVCIAYGTEVMAAPGPPNRASRLRTADRLAAAFRATYRELQSHARLGDDAVP
ncbi:MAG: 1-acyl-sn-glycerol-3-phosphate acyltransferase [Phycisphaerales bacterium]|nr:1-acyl-sn-glycerol-3-phosphate acyltransferase [Phycisphaerales bacterium]